MGKFQQDSDQQMDIQIPKHAKNHQNIKRKNKLIAKKTTALRDKTNRKQARVKSAPSKDLIRKYAKKVNLKKKTQSLEHKQEIFNKIVQGLKQGEKGSKSLSKKQRKKNRVILKKQLYKTLQISEGRRKTSVDISQMNIEKQSKKNPEKHKKSQFNERQKVAEFHQLMGAGLNNLRNIVAKNLSKS